MANWWQPPWLGTSWRTRKATGALAEYYDVPRAKEDQPIGDRKSTRLNSSHKTESRMPSSA